MTPANKTRFGVIGALILVTLGFVIFGQPNAAVEKQARADAALKPNPAAPAYDFTKDLDRDGLSDAKEFIFGTDPNNPDTDNDTYKDGGEVEYGYDPSVAGDAKLKDRPNLSLTIQYFLWAQTKTLASDPTLDQALIDQFLNERGYANFTLPPVPASDLVTAGASAQNVQTYLTRVSILALPKSTQNYSALAAESFTGQAADTASRVAGDLAKVYQDFAAIPTPPQALALQKTYLATLKVLQDLFNDLALAQKDPVRVVLNEKKGEWLSHQLGQLEALKQQLIKTL